MKKNVMFALLLFLNCFLSIQAQQEQSNENTSKKKVMKPKFTVEDVQNTISPNTIVVEGKVMTELKSGKDCNKNPIYFIEFNLEKIIESGHGVIHKPTTNKKHCLIVPKNLTKQFEKNSKEKMKLTITEQLCENSEKTVYKILSISPKK